MAKISPAHMLEIVQQWYFIESSLPTCNRCSGRVYEKGESECLDCRVSEQRDKEEQCGTH